MIATTRLNPTAAPHTEMVNKIIGIGVCATASEVEVNTTSIVNTMSIIVSTHIRASIRCLCCSDREIMVIMKAVYKVVLISSITMACGSKFF